MVSVRKTNMSIAVALLLTSFTTKIVLLSNQVNSLNQVSKLSDMCMLELYYRITISNTRSRFLSL
jgi:hypothetical protein